MPERRVKVPFPGPNGPLEDGSELSVRRSTERWSEIVLEDGTTLQIKPDAVSAIRIDGRFDQSGNPVYAVNVARMICSVVPKPSAELDRKAREKDRFQRLARAWREERSVRSSITEIAALVPYQKIIAMGEPAIPLILSQLESEGDEPDQWFWALAVLSDANPVPPEARGNVRAMAHSWIEWGKRTGYAWNLAAG
jgi:hypothetical protein